MQTNHVYFVLASCVAFTLWSCADSAVVATVDAAAADVALMDQTAQETTEPEKDVEATADDGSTADNAEAQGIECEPGEGCFMEDCDDNGDCLSGVCVPHMGDSVCSDFCEADCPDGWACKQVNVGASDVAYICVSNFSKLCVPCDDNADCTSDGSAAVCVSYGDDGAFCGASCETSSDCPQNFECVDGTSVDGGESKQCVPAGGALCECSDTSVTLGLSTPCASSNEFGTCEGIRTCSDQGLSECNAAEATAEICNGIDDNCDGSVDESTCDDGNACTEDSCAGDEGCVHTPLDGPGCDDGDACTIADYCQEGGCAGTPLECSDDNPCTVDSCDSDTGCLFPDYAGACDDGDDCTFGDLCQEGMCLPGLTMVCDDGNPCTDDACDVEQGCANIPNEASCDDGNACTEGDSCKSGACVPDAMVDCDDGNPCTSDNCDLATGCASIDNAVPCNDGNACTSSDTCSAGVCTGVGLDCDDGNPCTDDACNELVGCTHTNNSSECDDADPCTETDQCSLGQCVGLGAVNCDDGNPCTLDLCEPKAGCDYSGKEGPCDDGDACTVGDACQLGLCVGGVEPLVCNDGNPCTDEACDVEKGCVTTFNSDECDDGNACLSNDTCQNGACVGEGALECDDGNPCTTDSCDKNQGCIHAPNQAPCDDGDVCTLSDVCEDGLCMSGEAMKCDDGNQCTDDACNAEQGCLFTENNAACDDGNACTVGDACQDFMCKGQDALVCDDDNPCTDDLCDAIQGCIAFNNSNACNDDDACTEGDTCQGGTCSGGQILCDDGNVCTIDACDSDTGCTTSFDNAAGCDDGDECTGPDGCQDGTCLGSPIECDDNNPCTDETCDAALGCILSDNNNDCDDGNQCTEDDTCAGGSCTGVDVVCDDGDSCTSDACDPGQGCLAEAIVPCCGNGITENGEECDGENNCNENCEQDNPTVPNFSGELGPDFGSQGWIQCEGYYDTQGGNDIPQQWGNDCTGNQYNQIRLVCGATSNTYRYIDVAKNIFKDGLTGYSQEGLITASKDQNGNSFNNTNIIYATGNHPHIAQSWWGGGQGCGQNATNLTMNNGCDDWEASNCFGQGINGPRFLWIYVKP